LALVEGRVGDVAGALLLAVEEVEGVGGGLGGALELGGVAQADRFVAADRGDRIGALVGEAGREDVGVLDRLG
jgi:hypothetical protein